MIPSYVNLQDKCPLIYEQGDLNSCTANAVAANIQFLYPSFCPSRLFIYYNTRMIEGITEQDKGVQLKNTIKSLSIYGVCDESIYPYNIKNFNINPSKNIYNFAKKHLIHIYYIQDYLMNFGHLEKKVNHEKN